jgi:hypothetical protein
MRAEIPSPAVQNDDRRCISRLTARLRQANLTNVTVVMSASLPADPLEALRELARGETELDRLRYEQVRAAREAGASWEEIGAALGMSKQSAWEYFTRRVRSELAENAATNVDLDEEEATELAVEEVRTVRRRRRASAG